MITTETSYTIIDENSGATLIVSSDPDGLGLVHLTPSEVSKEQFFCDFELFIDPEMARALARALLKKADDVDREESK